VTIDEFVYVMNRIKSDLAARFADPEVRAKWQAATGGTPEEQPPIFSFDNPSSHTDLEALQQLGLADNAGEPTPIRLKLPAYSGDLHRTVERVHARICGKLQRWLDVFDEEYSMVTYCVKLRNIFLKSQTPEVISKCMWDVTGKGQHSLIALYKAVCDNGGRIPDRALR